MTKRKCTVCNGSGYEECEVHGRHQCGNCNGEGCIGGGIRIPVWDGPYRSPIISPPQPWRWNEVWCNTSDVVEELSKIPLPRC